MEVYGFKKEFLEGEGTPGGSAPPWPTCHSHFPGIFRGRTRSWKCIFGEEKNGRWSRPSRRFAGPLVVQWGGGKNPVKSGEFFSSAYSSFTLVSWRRAARSIVAVTGVLPTLRASFMERAVFGLMVMDTRTGGRLARLFSWRGAKGLTESFAGSTSRSAFKVNVLTLLTRKLSWVAKADMLYGRVPVNAVKIKLFVGVVWGGGHNWGCFFNSFGFYKYRTVMSQDSDKADSHFIHLSQNVATIELNWIRYCQTVKLHHLKIFFFHICVEFLELYRHFKTQVFGWEGDSYFKNRKCPFRNLVTHIRYAEFEDAPHTPKKRNLESGGRAS